MTTARYPPALLLAAALLLPACTAHLFSPAIVHPDRSRPVARIELRGAATQLGATTTEGIFFLGAGDRSGAVEHAGESEGPCRVHYFLGSDLRIDAGRVRRRPDSPYHEARIDLKTQAVPVLLRDLLPGDELVALVMEGEDVTRVPVRLATDPRVEGDVLDWPGRTLPRGAGIFRVVPATGGLEFAGLADGLAELTDGAGTTRFLTFTGPARMRELLALPAPLFPEREVRFRPDGVIVERPR